MARWSDDAVHELAIPVAAARRARLRGDLLHYTCATRRQHLRTTVRYATLAARRMHETGEHDRAWKRWVSPLATFLRTYFLRLGVLDGRRGLDICRMSAVGAWLKYEKLRRLAAAR
jgi:(heptosyl)LPS beta-1,4-glucosyltransferase